jgi:hypothetical protein
MDFDVFISYSQRDKPTADAACAVLEAAGIRCWIAPRDVRPGGEYGAAIIDAIDRCGVMVLIFSSSANDSRQIHREIERAVNKEVPIVPVRIEKIEPTKSMEYFLGGIHWLDALTPPLEKHLQQLTETVRAILNVDATARSAAVDHKASRQLTARPIGERDRLTRGDRAIGRRPEADGLTSKISTRRRWILAAVGVAGVAVLGAAALIYAATNQPRQTLGPSIDGWTASGGQILRFYPSPTAEACRRDCELEGLKCFAYTWVKPGGYQAGDGPVCYLDAWYNGIVKHSCCVTGNRGGTKPPGT